MTTTTAPSDVDVWGHTLALRAAQADVAAAIDTGDSAAAARALIVAAAAHGWPTATTLVYKREPVGTLSGFWALWRVEDAEGRVLREWDDEPDEMSDETDAERVALDLISNRPETQDYVDTLGLLTDSDAVGFHTLAL